MTGTAGYFASGETGNLVEGQGWHHVSGALRAQVIVEASTKKAI
jgi:hypothetical protein